MKRCLAALLVLSMLLLAGCAKKEPADAAPAAPTAPPAEQHLPSAEPAPAPKPEEPAPEEEAEGAFMAGGLEFPIPAEYRELIVADTEPESWSEHWEPLISLSERASVEAFARDNPGEDWGMGWLCSVTRLDRIGFEDWAASGADMGNSLFARDDEDRYYILSTPTDVRFYRSETAPDLSDADPAELEQWSRLNEWVNRFPQDVIARNALTAYDARELFEADYTYGGEHVDLGCRFPGQPMDLVILSLSQPARQGEGGVWCVERVREVYSDYNFTDTHLVFPASLGYDLSAADYYARLQSECDSGGRPELLAPIGAALDYARRVTWLFGEDISATDFEIIEALG